LWLVPLASTAPDQFLVNASGGFGINAVPEYGNFIASMPDSMEVTAGTHMSVMASADLSITSGRNHIARVGGTADYRIGDTFLVNAQEAIRAAAGNASARLEKSGDIALAGNDISLTAEPTGGVGSEMTVRSNTISLDSFKGYLHLYVKHLPAGGGTRALTVNDSGEVVTMASSERYKTDIRQLAPETDAVLSLKPVRFKYRDSGREDVGLIAEQVDEHIKDLVIYDAEGRPDAVKYDRVGVYVLEVVKELKAENDRFRARLDELEKRVDTAGGR
jgi:hypothetical protein